MPSHAFLEHDGVLAFAHRGDGEAAPENTAAAFESAVGLGFRYLETDVHCTRDGVLIAFHDDRLDRVTDQRGSIARLDYADVASARVLGREPIPLMEELLGNFPEIRFNIDPKSDAAVGPLIEVIRHTRAQERVCIGSVKELFELCEVSVRAGFMKQNPLLGFVVGDMSNENYNSIDLHKHIVDNIILCSDSGKKMYRDPDLIDVWFDSGAMPFAQVHYPFENKNIIDNKIGFPADFIAEGVDQTRGWFFTLHAISSQMLEIKVSFCTDL